MCVVATAPAVTDLDPSLVQNGRLHNIVELRPPEEHDRLDILTYHARYMDVDHQVLRSVAKRTKGLLGCDLEHICREAATMTVSEALANNPNIDSVSTVYAEHFEKALHLCRPSATVCNGMVKSNLRRYNDLLMELSCMYLTYHPTCLVLGSIFVPSVPHVSISSVIGCKAQIEALRLAILLPLRYPNIFERRGAKWTGKNSNFWSFQDLFWR